MLQNKPILARLEGKRKSDHVFCFHWYPWDLAKLCRVCTRLLRARATLGDLKRPAQYWCPVTMTAFDSETFTFLPWPVLWACLSNQSVLFTLVIERVGSISDIVCMLEGERVANIKILYSFLRTTGGYVRYGWRLGVGRQVWRGKKTFRIDSPSARCTYAIQWPNNTK